MIRCCHVICMVVTVMVHRVMVLLMSVMVHECVLVLSVERGLDIYDINEHGRAVWQLGLHCRAVVQSASAAADADEAAQDAETDKHCHHDPDYGWAGVGAVIAFG